MVLTCSLACLETCTAQRCTLATSQLITVSFPRSVPKNRVFLFSSHPLSVRKWDSRNLVWDICKKCTPIGGDAALVERMQEAIVALIGTEQVVLGLRRGCPRFD